MSLPILLDKSSFQSLSEKELQILFKYYFIIIPSVLINEIIGDLKKVYKDGLSEKKVILLANKFTGMCSAKHIFYKEILMQELKGKEIYMDFRPLVKSEPPKIDSNGEKSIIIKQSEEECAIERWRIGHFSVQEFLYSSEWRKTTKTIDLEKVKKSLKKIYSLNVKLTNFEEISNHIEDYFHKNKTNFRIIKTIYEEFEIPNKYYLKSFIIWNNSKSKIVADIFPYSVYCIKLKMFFELSLLNDLIGTRSTNLVDLEYIYYLPFCRVFSSGDKFHKRILPILLNSQKQDFIANDVLKEDLNNIYEDLRNKKNEFNLMDYPSPPAKSITAKLYKKLIKNTKNKNELPVDSEIDNIWFEKKLNINAPCPCGSGKKLKDCHYEN